MAEEGVNIDSIDPERWLERYRQGEYQAVWHEIASLEKVVREPSFYPHALATARETVQRAKANVEFLIQRLKTLEYRFYYEHHPDGGSFPPGKPPQSLDLDALKRLEPESALPISVWTWFEQVGTWVELNGWHPRLSMPDNTPGFGGVYPDPLAVESMPVEIEKDYRAWKKESDEEGLYLTLWNAPVDKAHSLRETGQRSTH